MSVHLTVGACLVPITFLLLVWVLILERVWKPCRSRRAGRGLSSAGAPPPGLRFWLREDRSSRHRKSFPPLRIPSSHQKDSTFSGAAGSFQVIKLLPAIMTTVSAAVAEGGNRQLRRRKEGALLVSATQVVASVMDGNSKHQTNRKKYTKAAVSSSPADEDAAPDQSREEPSDLEARLWNLDRTDQLTSLTVVELRGLMKHIGKPTAGRKEELIGEVKKWLTHRQAAANHLSVLDTTRPTRESSSDAESLEGTLLKAESNKSLQSEAMSRMTESYAGKDLQELSVEKKLPVWKDPRTTADGDNSLPNGNSISAAKLFQRATKRNKKPEKDSDDEDVQPPTVQVTEKKSRGARKGSKVEKEVEDSVQEKVSVMTTKTGQKRKVQVSKSSLSKKGKLTVEVGEVAVEKSAGPPWTLLVHKKPQPDWIVYNPETLRSEPLPCGVKGMKLMSWNVNGLRSLMKDKEKRTLECMLLSKLATEEEFDVLCLQETKLQEKDVEQLRKSLLSDYADNIWSCSTSKLGYSGTAVFSRIKPVSVKIGLGIEDHDSEGRLITVEFDNFFLLTSYVPNSGEKLARLVYRTEEWDTALSQHIKELEKQKPVILAGDLNCANEEIDIYNPDGNRKSAGFTNEERESFKTKFLNQGLVDTFRRQHPKAVGYTYWGYRSASRPKNQGWRLDYFLVSEALADQVHDSYVRPDVLGSDHCPIGMILKL